MNRSLLATANPALFGIALLALLELNLLAFFPGIMTKDSHNQLAQAISGQFTDQHPPIMALVWHWLLNLHGGPASMLALHILLFWGAIAVFGFTFIKTRPLLVWLYPLLWFLPPIMGMTAPVWKDTGLATSWLMVSALLTHYTIAKKEPGYAMAFLIATVFFYGLAVRHNAVLAAYPLSLWFVRVCAPAPGGHAAKAALAAILLLLLYLTSSALTASISSPTYMVQQVFLGDLGAISAVEKENYFPAYISQNKDFSPQALLNKENGKQVMFLPDEKPYYSNNPDNVAQLRGAWLAAIAAHPLDYVRNRVERFNGIMRIGFDDPFSPYATGKNPIKDGSGFADICNVAFRHAKGWLDDNRNSILNMPYVWLLLAAVIFVFSFLRLRQPPAQAALALTASSICYALGYFIVATGSYDMRLVYWSIASAAFAIPLALMALKKQ